VALRPAETEHTRFGVFVEHFVCCDPRSFSGCHPFDSFASLTSMCCLLLRSGHHSGGGCCPASPPRVTLGTVRNFGISAAHCSSTRSGQCRQWLINETCVPISPPLARRSVG